MNESEASKPRGSNQLNDTTERSKIKEVRERERERERERKEEERGFVGHSDSLCIWVSWKL